MVVYALDVYTKEYITLYIRGSEEANKYWNEKLNKREMVIND